MKRLNKELNENKMKHEREIKQTVKNLKSEIKSWKKSLGSEKSEKMKIERKLATVENQLKNHTSKIRKSISCQTYNTPDIPYQVTAALPPIFGSQLCHRSKPINHLSRSLPNLSNLSWVMVTEEDIIQDEAEQALNEQFDRQISDFYKESKSKTEAIQKLYKENAIGELFEDK